MKVYLCVDGDGVERLCNTSDLQREQSMCFWFCRDVYSLIELPKGTIENVIGKPLTWEDDPIQVEMNLTLIEE